MSKLGYAYGINAAVSTYQAKRVFSFCTHTHSGNNSQCSEVFVNGYSAYPDTDTLVAEPAPYIIGVTPTYGTAGTTVTITGYNFNNIPAVTIAISSLPFETYSCPINTSSSTEIVCQIPNIENIKESTVCQIQVSTQSGVSSVSFTYSPYSSS